MNIVLTVFGFFYLQAGLSSTISDQIRFRLESDEPGKKIEIRGTFLQSKQEILTFYADRNFEEVWSENGFLNELAYEMRFEIIQSKFDEDYAKMTARESTEGSATGSIFFHCLFLYR